MERRRRGRRQEDHRTRVGKRIAGKETEGSESRERQPGNVSEAMVG